MARPTKQGVDYFPLDVYLDDKFKFIEIKYGTKGFGILIKLLQKIYSCGYWYKWTDDEKLLFTGELQNVDINEVNACINEAIDRGIFDKKLFQKHQILTSNGIQKRYFEIVKRRKDVEVIHEYLVNVDINSINVSINPKNACKSTQSKVKESKVKESKEEVSNKCKQKSSLPSIDFDLIFKTWNEKVTSLPIKLITPKRKDHLQARIKEYGLDAIYQVIDFVARSKFLLGENSKGWKASFDWVFLPNNFIKVLEGTYNGGKKREKTKPAWFDDYKKDFDNQNQKPKEQGEKMTVEELEEFFNGKKAA